MSVPVESDSGTVTELFVNESARAVRRIDGGGVVSAIRFCSQSFLSELEACPFVSVTVQTELASHKRVLVVGFGGVDHGKSFLLDERDELREVGV